VATLERFIAPINFSTAAKLDCVIVAARLVGEWSRSWPSRVFTV